jgi:DNA-binding transcriptional regulator YiaG
MSLQLVENYAEKPYITTSAGSPMLGKAGYNWFIRVGGMLAVLSTTSLDRAAEQELALLPQDQTNSGVQTQEPQSSSAALMELRRVSGLTWDQLARLFGVTRRSLHFWVSGKSLNSANEERLHKLLATVRKLNRGSARENRSLLRSVREDGIIPYDLLIDGQYEKVLALLGPGQALSRHQLSPLSIESRMARKPLPPAELAGAMQDRVHKEVGKARVPSVAKDRK